MIPCGRPGGLGLAPIPPRVRLISAATKVASRIRPQSKHRKRVGRGVGETPVAGAQGRECGAAPDKGGWGARVALSATDAGGGANATKDDMLKMRHIPEAGTKRAAVVFGEVDGSGRFSRKQVYLGLRASRALSW